MGIESYTDDELKMELELRRSKKEKRNIPKQLENPNLTLLREMCRDYVESEYKDKNFEYYIFETAISAIYGTDIWDYIK